MYMGTVRIHPPALEEQKKIVKKLDVISEKARTLRNLQFSQFADLYALRQSILHEAFAA
jgi:restriction endonuclease S subunit